MDNKEVGQIGEDIACRFLMKRGFKILDRNFLRKCGEIDVVAKKADIVHFVEVKTVSRENLKITPNSLIHETYRPEDNIHLYKIKRLKRVIQLYLIEKCISCDWQFHAITVLFDAINREANVEFLENLIL